MTSELTSLKRITTNIGSGFCQLYREWSRTHTEPKHMKHGIVVSMSYDFQLRVMRVWHS